MGKGKRAKKKEGSKFNRFIFILLVVIIIVALVIFFIKMQKSRVNDYQDTENIPIISYYDEREERTVGVQNNQVFNEEMVISCDKGTMKISNDGKNYVPYNEDILEDGTYTIIVEAEDGSSSMRTFTIDTTPPDMTGIGVEDGKTYTTAPTITLNLDEIDTVQLKIEKLFGTAETKNLKKDGEKGTKKYTVEVSGSGYYTCTLTIRRWSWK